EYPIVGHNIQFDLAFLQRAGFNASAPALDTFELACILMPYASRYSLGKLLDELKIEFPTRHRALDDARATFQLFNALCDRATRLSPKMIQEIARLGDKADWPLKLAFQDLLRDRMRSSQSSGTIGAQLQAKGFVSDDENLGVLFSQDRDDKPLKPNAQTKPLDADALAEMLGPNGLFARGFPGYEHRPQQIAMMRAVATAFNHSGTLLVEAGTGTGKSVAYLLPAIYWAYQNNQRVVVSTNTINLQDQLFTKDIPDLKKILPFDFKVAILKGRSNYLCRRRLDALRRKEKLSVDEARVLAKVLAWLPSTTTGDNAELTLIHSENAVWASLASDADYCTPERCAHRDDQCFFYRAREKAERAHLLIINHALLLTNMALENQVLPDYQYLIVDEAHHLEAAATDALAFQASKTSLDALLLGLANQRGGLLGNLAGSLYNAAIPKPVKNEIQNLISDGAQDIDRAQRGVYDFFNALEQFLEHQELAPGESDNQYDRQIRITPARRAQPAWSDVEIAWDDFGARLAKARDGLEKIYGVWSDLEADDAPSQPDLEQELAAAMHRVADTRMQLEALVTKPQAGGIYWAQINARKGDTALHVAPLYVGEQLQKKLFAEKETVILTSATLSVNNNFAYIKSRLGIGEWADELAVGSPFDFKRAALVFLPTDIPEPGESGFQKTVEQALVQLFIATQGRALALFTSHSQLQATYRAITRPLEEEEVIVIAQNLDGSRRQVLETFKTQERTVLLGTRSFWEGIDVVGEALSCLVIARLPFSVPSDPIFAARSETFEDSFAQYSVPEAVLRFRQGFGRLIRSKNDRGIVVVLDKRVQTKRYGKMFIESLPEVAVEKKSLKELPRVAEQWLA
ncbi:MAG: DEAD/DEAH box helicase family protein, partial [Chloroflexi bacterium]|nr:DEAD/DEAH box helicase family protein [Chloroflexota bacterium]